MIFDEINLWAVDFENSLKYRWSVFQTFFVKLADMELKFDMRVYRYVLQIKYESHSGSVIFDQIMSKTVFQIFLLNAC